MKPWMRDPRRGGVAVLAAVLATLPLLLDNNYQRDIAILAGINAIVAVGLDLLIGYCGQISLGHAAFFGLGAYASAILTGRYGWPAPAALVGGAVGVGVVAWVVGRPILKLAGHYLAMATLGVGVIISIVLNTESWLTGGPDGLTVAPFAVAGMTLDGERAWYWVVAGALLATVVLALNLIDSPIGRALRAVKDSEAGAAVAGIDVARFKLMVFVLSAVLAAVAGSLFAHYSGMVTPGKASFLKSVELVVMVVFGGLATSFGAVVGAVVLTVLPNALAAFEDYESVILGLVMMGTMIFMPQGLLPSVVRLVRRRGGDE